MRQLMCMVVFRVTEKSYTFLWKDIKITVMSTAFVNMKRDLTHC